MFLTLTALQLPVTVARFLLDSDRNFRLRVIVLAFVFGTALEITAALRMCRTGTNVTGLEGEGGRDRSHDAQTDCGRAGR